MSKIEEKVKVGRPKLADKELIKDSWCRIAASSAIALVMVVCMVGIITVRTPWQVLSFQNIDNLSGNVVSIKDPSENSNVRIIDVKSLRNTRTIPAKKNSVRIIRPDGTVTNIIPANTSLNN